MKLTAGKSWKLHFYILDDFNEQLNFSENFILNGGE